MLSRPVTLALIFAAWASATPFSESIRADFYQGKNIRMIVGLAAGGGYDTYTRAIARHRPPSGQTHSRQSVGGRRKHDRRRQCDRR
jgi:tripartite-type tricarboxylate transporter receptor subunit TctC